MVKANITTVQDIDQYIKEWAYLADISDEFVKPAAISGYKG